MPNWCRNRLIITGSKDSINDLYKKVQGKTLDHNNKEVNLLFSLNKIKPMPEELETTTYPSDSPNWHDWRMENWGVKWDIAFDECNAIRSSQDCLEYDFDSPWGPPIEAIKELYLQYLDLEFELWYLEPGMAFVGQYLISKDQEIDLAYQRPDKEYAELAMEMFDWDDENWGNNY